MRTTFIAVWLAVGSALSGAGLSVSSININPSGTAAVEVRYTAQGAQVAALQFDLHYDSANLKISAVAGPAAVASEKVVGSAELTPGTTRILLMGFSQSVLGDGVVISLLVSSISGATGSYPLQLTDAVASDSFGVPIEPATTDGIVTMSSNAEMASIAAFGQVVSGAQWKTTFTLVNNSSAPAKARLKFWDNDGQPLVLPLASPDTGGPPPTAASSVDCSLDPGAICTVETAAPDATSTLAGWADLQSSDGVTGFATLRETLAADRDAEAMLPFDQRTGEPLVLAYDNSGSFVTGIAIANRSADSPADLALVLRDESGATISTESLTLPVRGHVAFVASQRYPYLAGRRGTIEIQNRSAGEFTALGLRFSPLASFTSVPVISK